MDVFLVFWEIRQTLQPAGQKVSLEVVCCGLGVARRGVRQERQNIDASWGLG